MKLSFIGHLLGSLVIKNITYDYFNLFVVVRELRQCFETFKLGIHVYFLFSTYFDLKLVNLKEFFEVMKLRQLQLKHRIFDTFIIALFEFTLYCIKIWCKNLLKAN